jgi:hypothetical protein
VRYIILLYDFELFNIYEDEISILVGYDFTSLGNWFQTFEGNVVVSMGN